MMGKQALLQGPIETGAMKPDSKDVLLAGFAAPVRAIHHPQEGWLDPGHSVQPKRWYQRSNSQSCRRDWCRVGLIYEHGIAREGRSDLSVRPSLH